MIFQTSPTRYTSVCRRREYEKRFKKNHHEKRSENEFLMYDMLPPTEYLAMWAYETAREEVTERLDPTGNDKIERKHEKKKKRNQNIRKLMSIKPLINLLSHFYLNRPIPLFSTLYTIFELLKTPMPTEEGDRMWKNS